MIWVLWLMGVALFASSMALSIALWHPYIFLLCLVGFLITEIGLMQYIVNLQDDLAYIREFYHNWNKENEARDHRYIVELQRKLKEYERGEVNEATAARDYEHNVMELQRKVQEYERGEGLRVGSVGEPYRAEQEKEDGQKVERQEDVAQGQVVASDKS
jgi:hypothetical protein